MRSKPRLSRRGGLRKRGRKAQPATRKKYSTHHAWKWAFVLVRFNHIASVIVNANNSTM
jgi:hypothetical protein